jgi:Ca2+-binding EF-hand superfamily protein
MAQNTQGNSRQFIIASLFGLISLFLIQNFVNRSSNKDPSVKEQSAINGENEKHIQTGDLINEQSNSLISELSETDAEAFRFLDGDADGEISHQEFFKKARHLLDPSVDLTQTWIAQDTNNDGRITPDEFGQQLSQTNEHGETAFTSGSNYLPQQRQQQNQQQQHHHQQSNITPQGIMGQLDINRDQLISKEEFDSGFAGGSTSMEASHLWDSADSNTDGFIDITELTLSLQVEGVLEEDNTYQYTGDMHETDASTDAAGVPVASSELGFRSPVASSKLLNSNNIQTSNYKHVAEQKVSMRVIGNGEEEILGGYGYGTKKAPNNRNEFQEQKTKKKVILKRSRGNAIDVEAKTWQPGKGGFGGA